MFKHIFVYFICLVSLLQEVRNFHLLINIEKLTKRESFSKKLKTVANFIELLLKFITIISQNHFNVSRHYRESLIHAFYWPIEIDKLGI